MKYLGGENGTVDIRLTTEIPVGKGMASSSADISAVCQASAMALGKHLSPEEIGRIAISIEPSDAVFYRGIVQYDYRKGMLIRRLGECPEAKLLVFDCGGSVDTLAFNSRKDLVALQQANEKEIRRAVDLLRKESAGGIFSLSAGRRRSALLQIRKSFIKRIWLLLGSRPESRRTWSRCGAQRNCTRAADQPRCR